VTTGVCHRIHYHSRGINAFRIFLILNGSPWEWDSRSRNGTRGCSHNFPASRNKGVSGRTDAFERTLSRMAELSTSPEEWNERATLSNYRCRGCQNLITFEDQNLYFVQGYCAPCFESLNPKRFGPSSDRGNRVQQIRDRQSHD
jgi:hypothetical protein